MIGSIRTAIPLAVFLADLRQQIAAHCTVVAERIAPLADDALGWQPTSAHGKAEWSILQCFGHLNLTHDYYMAKIEAQLAGMDRTDPPCTDGYRASFWGGIYIFFSLNPNYTFPSPEPVTPVARPHRSTLDAYLARQDALLALLDRIAPLDLVHTRLPIEKFVRFNLGDCCKILVYHDALHIGQAMRVYAMLPQPRS